MSLDEIYKAFGIYEGKFRAIDLNLGMLRTKYKDPADVIAAITFPQGEIARYSVIEISFMLYLNGFYDGKESMNPVSSIDVNKIMREVADGKNTAGAVKKQL